MTDDTKPTRPVPGGLLVAFEGADGAGKTTQARQAVDALCADGYDAIYLREPTDGPHGRRLRELMVAGRESLNPHDEFRLFLEDRREDVGHNIRPALDRGAIVCMDRYYISSMAYQGALGLDPEMIRHENEKFAPVPALILLFHLPVAEAQRRIAESRRGGQNLFEARAYQERVAEILRTLNFPQAVPLDAARPPDVIQADVLAAIRTAVENRLTHRA